MSLQRVANWLKSENENSAATDYITNLKNELKKIQQNI